MNIRTNMCTVCIPLYSVQIYYNMYVYIYINFCMDWQTTYIYLCVIYASAKQHSALQNYLNQNDISWINLGILIELRIIFPFYSQHAHVSYKLFITDKNFLMMSSQIHVDQWFKHSTVHNMICESYHQFTCWIKIANGIMNI